MPRASDKGARRVLHVFSSNGKQKTIRKERPSTPPPPSPAARPVAQAQRKLWPPIGPKASRISPQRKRPGWRRLSSVRGSISERATPPPVTSALAVALVARPGEGIAGERLDQAAALLAAELGEARRAVDPGVGEERVGQAVRAGARRSRPDDGAARPRGSRRSQASASSVGPLHEDRLRRAAGQARAHGEVRDVEHRRAAVAAMGEEKAAVGRERPFGPGARRVTVREMPASGGVAGRLERSAA